MKNVFRKKAATPTPTTEQATDLAKAHAGIAKAIEVKYAAVQKALADIATLADVATLTALQAAEQVKAQAPVKTAPTQSRFDAFVGKYLSKYVSKGASNVR